MSHTFESTFTFADRLQEVIAAKSSVRRELLPVQLNPRLEAVRARDWPIKVFYSVMRVVREQNHNASQILDIGSSVEVSDEERDNINSVVELSHQESLGQGSYSDYPSSWGDSRLRSSIAGIFHRNAGVELDPKSEVMVTGGIINAVDTFFQALDRSHVITPSLFPYFVGSLAILRGKELLEMPLDLHSGNYDLYTLEKRLIEGNIADGQALMYLTLPSAPAGTLPEDDFIEKELIPFCKAHNILVISDSYIFSTTFSEEPIRPLLSYRGAMDVAVEAITVAKEMGLPSARIGGVAGHPGIIDAMRLYAASSLSMWGLPNQNLATHAFTGIDPNITARRLAKVLYKDILPRFRTMNWPVIVPQAGLDMMVRVPKAFLETGKDQSLFASIDILMKYGVAFCPVSSPYGSDGINWLRLVLKQADGKIARALDRMMEMGFKWESDQPTPELYERVEKLINGLDLTKL